jgi:hypothetical protein
MGFQDQRSDFQETPLLQAKILQMFQELRMTDEEMAQYLRLDGHDISGRRVRTIRQKMGLLKNSAGRCRIADRQEEQEQAEKEREEEWAAIQAEPCDSVEMDSQLSDTNRASVERYRMRYCWPHTNPESEEGQATGGVADEHMSQDQ